MQSSRYQFWLGIRLIFTAIFVGLFCQQTVLSQDKSSTKTKINKFVKNAIQAELQGSRQQRNHWLNATIESDPSHKLARWYLGQVLVTKKGEQPQWLTINEYEKAFSADSELAKYQSIRNAKSNDLKGNESIAEWCWRNGQNQRARAHWLRVLQLQPNHRKALGRLGLRNYHGLWLTREQVLAVNDRRREIFKIKGKWRPVFANWRRNFSKMDTTAKQDFRQELNEIACPELVGLMETILSSGNEELVMAVIEAIDGVPHQVATESLLRHAVFSKWRSVRSEAARRLKNRPLHGYVPILIDAMMSPLEFRSWNVKSAYSGDRVLAMRYSIGQQGKHVNRMVRGSVTFLGEGNDDNADDAREEILERIEEINEAREKFNRPLAQVLQSTTGKDFKTNPSQWNDWWNEFNEYYVPDYKPVMTTFRRPTRVIVATRPFSCFPAGTLVSTESGKKPIEKIRVGDFVLSKNAKTGELRYQPVLQVTVRESDAILQVTMPNELLRVTRGHPMWVNGKQWQMAKQLRPGSILHGAQGPLKVQQIRDARMKTKVYNLVVDEFHTYFVGESRLFVHDNTLYQPPGVSVPGQ